MNLGDLTTYDMAKHFLLRHTEVGLSAMTGVIVAARRRGAGARAVEPVRWPGCRHTRCHVADCAMLMQAGTPADVVKTRVMSAGSVYRGSWDCLCRTV